MFLQIFVLVILILLNAFFAAAEIAFISLNDAKIDMQAKEGNKKAIKIKGMLKNPSKFLATIQIGITLAGFLSSAFATDAFADLLAPQLNNIFPVISLGTWKGISIIIITIILSFFTLVFGELVPKRIAMKYYEKVAFASIGIIKIIYIATQPFVKLLTIVTNGISKLFGIAENEEEIVTEEEIKMLIDEGQEKGSIEENEKQLINNVFEFNDITVSEIMTHRTDIYAIDINSKVNDLIEELDEYKYSRIPVYEDSIDEIKGILYLKDVLKYMRTKENEPLKQIIRPAYFVAQSKPIDEVFQELQKKNNQMAIVVDEYGGTSGIVTVEDILEEIVGEIQDEFDEDEELDIKKLDKDSYIVQGTATITEINKVLNIEIEKDGFDSIGGWMFFMLGMDIEINQSVDFSGYRFKVVEIDKFRVISIKIERIK